MSKKYLGRYRFIAGFVAFLFVVLIVQLFNLQIRDYDVNQASAEKKKTKTITSQGRRGTIMDVNSMTLAYDKQIYNVQFYRDPNFVSSAAERVAAQIDDDVHRDDVEGIETAEDSEAAYQDENRDEDEETCTDEQCFAGKVAQKLFHDILLFQNGQGSAQICS